MVNVVPEPSTIVLLGAGALALLALHAGKNKTLVRGNRLFESSLRPRGRPKKG